MILSMVVRVAIAYQEEQVMILLVVVRVAIALEVVLMMIHLKEAVREIGF